MTSAAGEPLAFYEFFAGGGMARVGLGDDWACSFANDNSRLKIAAYKAAWGADELDERGIDEVRVGDLPPGAHLAWASFPCQDLSVAGNGKGVGSANDRATRSSALWPFLKLMNDLRVEGRHPTVLVLENVPGLLLLNEGRGFIAICEALAELDYVFGAVIVDARHFVAQSRPRVFVVAARSDAIGAQALAVEEPVRPWHNAAVVSVEALLPPEVRARWRWWNLGEAPVLADDALEAAIDLSPGADWHDDAETRRLVSMMPPAHLARLESASRAGKLMIGSLYLRMRPTAEGNVQCAEIAFGATLGCLRTPRGGASRPRIIVVDGETVMTRLLSAREAATLMGLPDGHPLPKLYEHAFQLIGDGVVAPVVSFVAKSLIEPIARAGMGAAPPTAKRGRLVQRDSL